MQRIELKKPEPRENPILYIDNLCEYELQNKIIVYVTKCHNDYSDHGIGILTFEKYAKFNNQKQTEWGFKYHRDLLTNDSRKMTFTGTSAIKAIRKCVEAGREVVSFDRYKEFLEFAMEHGAY